MDNAKTPASPRSLKRLVMPVMRETDWLNSCDQCRFQGEGKHYCNLHSKQIKNMDTKRCADHSDGADKARSGLTDTAMADFCDRKAGEARFRASQSTLAEVWRPRLIAEAEMFEAIAGLIRRHNHTDIHQKCRISDAGTKNRQEGGAS